jgi:hypothetical protein
MQHAGPAAKATCLLMITCPEDNAAVNCVFSWAKFYSIGNKGTFHKPPHFAVRQGSFYNGA